MKIRNDFVTNSSSSSFIIMIKSMPEVEKETLEKYPFIKSYVKRLESMITSDSEKITNIKELEDYIINQRGWRNCDTLEKIFKELKEKLEQGYNIFFKDVDHNDESAYDMLNELDDGDNFIVICED